MALAVPPALAVESVAFAPARAPGLVQAARTVNTWMSDTVKVVRVTVSMSVTACTTGSIRTGRRYRELARGPTGVKGTAQRDGAVRRSPTRSSAPGVTLK